MFVPVFYTRGGDAVVFSKKLDSLDRLSGSDAIKQLANHIRVMQEELEYRLMVLDSSNIAEIDLGETNVMTTDGNSLNKVLSDASGNYAQLSFTVGGLQSTVASQGGSISSLQQTASAIQSTVATQGGDISTLKQTATTIQSTVATQGGDISTLKQTATKIESTVQTQGGDISKLKQTATSIEASVGSLETGLGQTVRIAADGVTITNAEGSKLTIDGGQINAENLNLTGRITFSDMDYKTNLDISNAISDSSYAKDGLVQMANGTFRGEQTRYTFIDGTNIYSPNLYGQYVTLVDEYGYVVGQISLKSTLTEAFDITSRFSLRLVSASGANAYFGTGDGLHLQLGSGCVKLGGGALVIPDQSFGTSLPTYPSMPGEVFFVYS